MPGETFRKRECSRPQIGICGGWTPRSAPALPFPPHIRREAAGKAVDLPEEMGYNAFIFRPSVSGTPGSPGPP